MDGTQQTLTPADAATPHPSAKGHVLGWFSRILPKSFFQSLQQDLEIVSNACIFTLNVTTWLMIMQRLSPGGTLAAALQELVHGSGGELLEPCKRVREKRISSATGAYSQARQRLPAEAARRVTEQSFSQLHSIRAGDGLRDRLFLLDGSSIRLEHAPEVVRQYPPARNQHGDSHWPVLRVAVMHHVVTALAMAPQFGPMYGNKAVSEQHLAEALIDRLPEGSVLIGDRNFGVFSVAWHAHKRGHQVLIRLTQDRVQRLCGDDSVPEAGSGRKIVWQPSRDDRRSHPELKGEERIEGYVMAAHSAGDREILYFFTTLQQTAQETAGLYKERWNIETDLRSLKNEVRLHAIKARSPQLIACELMMAITAYNLIRTVMAEAAREIGIEPRRLSFSLCRTSFQAFTHAVAHVTSEEEFQQKWRILIRSFTQSKLPTRNRPPAPRVVWRPRQNFPFRNQVKKNGE